MRTLTLTSAMLCLLSFAVNAQQFSILPQAGLEVSRTTIKYNDLKCLSPLARQVSPEVGVRMDYQFKKGHGPMLGLSTSRSSVEYSFQDPETGMTSYKATPGDLRLHVEAGYSFRTKAISLGRGASVSTSKAPVNRQNAYHGMCPRYPSRFPGAGYRDILNPAQQKNKGWSVVIQPMAALALIRPMASDVHAVMEGSQSAYQYNAGNWSTALVTGASFEFGKNDQRKFTISMSCLHGIGNLEARNITTVSGGKATTTSISSGVSSFNLKAGIPITIYKKKTFAKSVQVENINRPAARSWQCHSRCIRSI